MVEKDMLNYIVEKIKEKQEAIKLTYILIEQRESELDILLGIRERLDSKTKLEEQATKLARNVLGIDVIEEKEIPLSTKTKVCLKCKIEKTLDNFHKDTSLKDGHQNWCKKCKGEYMIAYNKENYPLQNFPEVQGHKTHKGYEILCYINKVPIHKEIVEQIKQDTNKWVSMTLFKTIFIQEFPHYKSSSLKKTIRSYKNYFESMGYKIETKFDHKKYYIRLHKELDIPISKGDIPLVDSGEIDKKTVKNWSKFRMGNK